jgi:hypothetical protein
MPQLWNVLVKVGIAGSAKLAYKNEEEVLAG